MADVLNYVANNPEINFDLTYLHFYLLISCNKLIISYYNEHINHYILPFQIKLCILSATISMEVLELIDFYELVDTLGKRIAELRLIKGVSARDMSLSLGQGPV